MRLIGTGGGNFNIEFRYEVINWTTGDASGGANAADDEEDLTGINCSCASPARSGSPGTVIGLVIAAGISLGRRRRR